MVRKSVPWAVIYGAAEYWAEKLVPESDKPGEDSGGLADFVRDRFAEKFANQINQNSIRHNYSLEFGSKGSYDPPREMVDALEALKMSDLYAYQVASGIKTTVHASGMMELETHDSTECIYVGEGIEPKSLEKAHFRRRRVKNSPLVMIVDDNQYIYCPVEEGTDITEVYSAWNGPEYRQSQTDQSGFLFANAGDVKREHLDEVMQNPNLLASNPEYVEDLCFITSSDDCFYRHLCEYFTAQKGVQIP
ncbi:hypothetical protein CL622_01090 [archaeon]|nr:hypothetical protein [archaeon]